jgi:hypothetical protein
MSEQTTLLVRGRPEVTSEDGLIVVYMDGIQIALTRHAAFSLQNSIANKIAALFDKPQSAEILPFRAAK